MVEEAVKAEDSMESELKNYVEDGLKKGYSKEEIREILLGQGFGREIVDKVLGFGSGKGRKTAIWVFVIILIVCALGAGGYFGWKYWSEIEGVFVGDEVVNNINEDNLIDDSVIEEERLTARAVSAGSYTICDRETTEKDKLGCKISVAVSLGDSSFCSNVDDSITFEYYVGGTGVEENVSMGARDYCWISMTSETGVDYCNNVLDEENKEICRREINESG